MVLIAQPSRIPLVDPQTGLITREWQRYFTGLYQRAGGAQGESTTDLTISAFEDAGIEEMKAGLYALADTVQSAPMQAIQNQVEYLETEAAGMRAEIAALRQQIADIQQGAVWP
jgi:polyhydroxyalkanoate synthesis regulator phasin